MRLFNRGKEERERQREFTQNIQLATAGGKAQARAMTKHDRQQIASLGPAYFLHDDENFLGLLRTYFAQLYGFFSRLNSTGQIRTERERERLELLLEDAILHEEMHLPKDELFFLKKQMLKGAYYYGINRISDAWEGYRGRLVTEERERTYVHTEPPKKKGFL